MSRKKTVKKPAKPKLTGKQALFAVHYAACLNGTEAARQAGYKGNDVTLAAVAYENLRKPHVKAEIDRLLKQRTIEPIEVLARLSQQATGDISDFVEVHPMSQQPKLNLTRAVERGKMHLIKKMNFSERTGFLKSIELYDSQAALVHIGKAYALFTEKLQVEDWRTQVLEDVRNGTLTIDQVIAAFGGKEDLEAALGKSAAARLFDTIGVQVVDATE